MGPSPEMSGWPHRPPSPESAGPSGMSNSTGMAPLTLLWDAAFPDARPHVASHVDPRHPRTGTHIPLPWRATGGGCLPKEASP
ncbi:JerE [Lasius niger]|uniref:JerE n=1 Tax=Lasius niger TaxID=67767 RepID=A0A0J7K7Z4_LASNI|nr:JerE [Lasius niger]